MTRATTPELTQVILNATRTRTSENVQGREGFSAADTLTRSSELRRAIAVAWRLTTSVERAQGLTAAMANTAVDLAQRTTRQNGWR